MKDLRSAEVTGKVVALRTDLNVPTSDSGEITDDTRIVESLPTIKYLGEAGAKVLVLSHFKRPEGRPVPSMSLKPVAAALADLLGKEVDFVADCVGPTVAEAVARLKPGGVALAENLRFHPGETANDPGFARELARPAQLFVNDAFGTCHRAHASVVGLAALLPAYPGFLLEKELNALHKVLENPQRPLLAIVGGAKVSTKIGVLENLVDKVDFLLLGGGMANTFLAARGIDMGRSLVETDHLDTARRIMEKAAKARIALVLPADGVMAESIESGGHTEIHDVNDVPEGWMMLDIGPTSVGFFASFLQRAATIVWNGPMGVFERWEFAEGTRSVAREVAESNAYSVVGGGDSVAALKELQVEDRIDHISTGGGASLEMLEGKTLPGIAALS